MEVLEVKAWATAVAPDILRRRAASRHPPALGVSLTAEPRSAYLLPAPSRTEWEHSVSPVAALRYSVTYRNLR